MTNSTDEALAADERRKRVAELVSRKLRTDKVKEPLASWVTTVQERNIHDFSTYPEIKLFEQQKNMIAECRVANPYFRVNGAVTGSRTTIEGQDLISFSGYNYLGLSGAASVAAKAKEAIDKYGTSPSASRLVTGEKPVHGELERALADFLGTESAVVFPSGHATNVTVIGHFFNSQDLILYDELSHNSIIEGCVLSGARRIPFPHNDYKKCESLIAENIARHDKVVVMLEGAYSMDGDITPLDKFVQLRAKYPVLLYVDEAHSLGTIGQTGRGVSEYFNVDPGHVDFWMGTLSKSLASNGGYIAGRRDLIEYLKYTTPGFVYTAGATPANAAAALESLNLLREQPERVERLHHNAERFRTQARRQGFNIGPSKDTPIVPIVVGDSKKAIVLADRLYHHGICVHPIFYPTVPVGEARLRFFISSAHSEEDIDYTIDRLTKCLSELDAAE